MENTDLILADDFCLHHHVSYTFITQLYDAGLVEVVTIDERHFLPVDKLTEVEKLVNFHTDLDVNVEGIEVIANMLLQMKALQRQLRETQNRLGLYED
ncbi:MAG: MerR family transcriptional regulator [Sphingobacteriales bacterium]|nr:MAG: MerR family transcriptional regulator [Sphingobacteriales bacterium]